MDELELTKLIEDYVSDHEDKYTGSYIAGIVKIVRSWLNYNGKDLKRKIKIKGALRKP